MTIRCGSQIIDLSTPKIMGIINCTPDSFYASSRYMQEKNVVTVAQQMLEEGADFLDLGGMSTRPGSKPPSEKDEIERISTSIKGVLKAFPDTIISIDTYRSNVARAALDLGARVVNDVSAGEMDAKMFDLIAEKKVPYILMHMQGTPENMQNDPNYEDVVVQVNEFIAPKVNRLLQMGATDLILDPGFGFGKTLEQNYKLLKAVGNIGFGDFPVLAGLSRKSMIYKPLNITPERALNGTTVCHTLALLNGANILRVHDVKPAKEAVRILEKYSHANA